MKNLKAFLSAFKLGILTIFNFKFRKILPEIKKINNIKLKLYKTKNSIFPVIVLHGITRKGIDDMRLVLFCRHLALTGFIAITPNLVNLTNFKLDFNDIEIINSAVEYTVKTYNNDAGIIGFSFGASYGLIASMVSPLKDRIRFILCASPYYSLFDNIKSIFNDPNKNIYAVLAMDYQFIKLLKLTSNDLKCYNEIMDNYCEKEKNFSSREKALIEKIVNSKEQKSIFDKIKKNFSKLKKLDLEINTHIKNLKSEIFLLHNKRDDIISYNNTVLIYNALKKFNKKVHICIINSGNKPDDQHMKFISNKIDKLFGMIYKIMKLRY